MTEPDCLFCRIVAGDVPATVVHRTGRTVAFADVNPVAPTHLLVVPTGHFPDAAALAAADPAWLGEVLAAATGVATAAGLDAGYRLVVNTGPDAGQSVAHLHVHVLGGRHFTWPPG